MSEVIVITSGKGGVGKTTATANIGMGLARMKKRTVVIDTDIGLRNLDVVLGWKTGSSTIWWTSSRETAVSSRR